MNGHKIQHNDPILRSANKNDYLIRNNGIDEMRLSNMFLITKKLPDGFEIMCLAAPNEILKARFQDFENGIWYLIIIPNNIRRLVNIPLA